MSKVYQNKRFEFRCNRCGKLLAAHENEQKALMQAREQSDIQGWIWDHPGWRLYCDECKKRVR